MVLELKDEPVILQEVAQHLFAFLESHSLFKSAEYLALKMLNDESCTLNAKSISLFEQYRKLAVGKTAPDIVLDLKTFEKLSNFNNKYKLVVFGASWCPSCQMDYPKLKETYANYKSKNDLEIFYISIDTEKAAYENYYKESPFITYCDAKGWETQAAKEYYVTATPTYILLDKDLKILAKINSPEHLEVWMKTAH